MSSCHDASFPDTQLVFPSTCFSHQPPAPPSLHLPQSASPRAASVKPGLSRGVSAVNLCILGLIGCGASGPKRCQQLHGLTQLNLENSDVCEIETICQVAANCSIRVNAARDNTDIITGLIKMEAAPLNTGYRHHNEEHLQTITAPCYLLMQHSTFVISSIYCYYKPAEHRLCVWLIFKPHSSPTGSTDGPSSHKHTTLHQSCLSARCLSENNTHHRLTRIQYWSWYNSY